MSTIPVGSATSERLDTMDSLLRVCALPPSRFAQVMRSSDGHYLARANGDIGFNAFLGKPNPHPQPSTTALAWSVWNGLPRSERRALVLLAQAYNVRLRDFLRKLLSFPTDGQS